MYNRDTLIEQSLNCSRAHTFNYPQCAFGYWLVMLYYLQESEAAKVASVLSCRHSQIDIYSNRTVTYPKQFQTVVAVTSTISYQLGKIYTGVM